MKLFYVLAFLLGAFFILSDARSPRSCFKKLNSMIFLICEGPCEHDASDMLQLACSGTQVPKSEIKLRCCP
ncbi:Protein CBG18853 [Caenorhabditis briggsae]|uniref:Protein CBG18853 n=1 Tax=Caenorhabditis briggsae TaxID=6238 RepID=A8XU78_CAEBR|nr:Protein CBG18853 [Caenorhabditis briggsae]CAP36203.1 Protein CBG18853 [Caenorhabditis briggsae]